MVIRKKINEENNKGTGPSQLSLGYNQNITETK